MKKKEEDFDVVIVGSGASGAAVAWKLSTSSMKVLCLEQGPNIPSNSYKNNFDWELRKKQTLILAQIKKSLVGLPY